MEYLRLAPFEVFFQSPPYSAPSSVLSTYLGGEYQVGILSTPSPSHVQSRSPSPVETLPEKRCSVRTYVLRSYNPSNPCQHERHSVSGVPRAAWHCTEYGGWRMEDGVCPWEKAVKKGCFALQCADRVRRCDARPGQ